jgi:hypothetical protein
MEQTGPIVTGSRLSQNLESIDDLLTGEQSITIGVEQLKNAIEVSMVGERSHGRSPLAPGGASPRT